MRIDHHAYQRATRVAGIGFLIQIAIGLVLLIFGLVAKDTAFQFASSYVLLGLLVWLGLIVIFNQHKLERLEVLEEDELAVSRGHTAASPESVFAAAEDEIHVAARRLRLMYKWFMPILSLVLAAGLAGSTWLMLRFSEHVHEGTAEFRLTEHIGWAVAICLVFSAVAFIVSRFVAGMAKQPVWQNLRGGAAYMVGNALVTLAIAIGVGFRFFKNTNVIEWIAWGIAIFMAVVAVEIVLNFVLNLYRPRIAGETPRPAFDSRLLSLFATPDSIVKSFTEAVDYQFGFDITSSWGYKLLIRSFAWLIVVGALVLMVLNMMVIVEPQQQAIRLSHGRLGTEAVHGSGIVWKLPWPFQTAEKYDVTTICRLHLTGAQVRDTGVNLWADDLGHKFDKPLVPFIVKASQVEASAGGTAAAVSEEEGATADKSEQASRNLSLVDAEVILAYQIREDGGLLRYLDYSSAPIGRRERVPVREEALRAIALRSIRQEMARLRLDEVLGSKRAELPARLRRRVQEALDADHAGVDVVSVDLPLLRPAGKTAAGFEELSVDDQARQKFVASARQLVVAGFAQLVGDPDRIDAIYDELVKWEGMRDDPAADPEAVNAQKVRVERMLVDAGGEAAETIARAERDRWVKLLDTRAEASRVRGQTASYRTAPELFRVRALMQVYASQLSDLYKYVICVDPSRVEFDFDLKELGSLFNISDALQKDKGESGQ